MSTSKFIRHRRKEKGHHISGKVVRSTLNPLFVLANTAVNISDLRKRDKYYDTAWRLFSRYVTYKLESNKSKEGLSWVVLKAERQAMRFHVKLEEVPTDLTLETGALLYFILASENLLGRYREQLVIPMLDFAKRCMDDYRHGLVTLESSPALRRCLGIAYILYDEIEEEEYRRLLNNLIDLCENGAYSEDFCVYSTFTTVLRLTFKKTDQIQICKNLYIVKRINRVANLKNAVLLFLTVGFLNWNKCDTEEIALRFFQKVSTLMIDVNPLQVDKSTWFALSLALRLNDLKRITYVTEKYIAIRAESVRTLIDIVKKMIKNVTVVSATIMAAFSILDTFIRDAVWLKILIFIMVFIYVFSVAREAKRRLDIEIELEKLEKIIDRK